MSEPLSPLRQALTRGLEPGADFVAELEALGDYAVATEDDARALAEVVDRLPPKRPDDFLSPLHRVVGLFQAVETREAFDVLRAEGVPRLLARFDAALPRSDDDDVADDLLFLLKVASMYRTEEAVERVVRAARRPLAPDAYLWSVVFATHDENHPFRVRLVQALSQPLPPGFLGVAYLDLANAVVRDGYVSAHPFDTPEGKARLRAYLTERERVSYSHSATAALPFIGRPERDDLLALAMDHPEAEVQLQAAWAAARLGSDGALKLLARACLEPATSKVAVAYLNELGRGGHVPSAALDSGFQAKAEMAAWLAHPNEFGRAPASLEVVESRELNWPPTGDRRRLWLVRYRYEPDAPGGGAQEGVGLVGSVTFALFGEATADLSADDLYALYCAWELQVRNDPRAPRERTVEAGRAILDAANRG